MTDPSTRALTATSEIQIGSTLGSYELVDMLGKGAMGRVYRARHVLLGREVAVKVLNSEYVARPDVVQRFFREARVVNDIDHENIVEVTDFVEQPGLAYLVMELLDGVSLREMMRQRGRKYPPVKRIVPIMVQICDALEAAHAKGVVHRDLKPDNVFVAKRDGEDFVKVLDFGVAKLRDTEESMETSAGMILGTPHYMAPEQALGKEVDRLTDLWAAGVVLYELLAGFVPFKANSFVELAMQIREQPAKPLPAKTPRGERIPPWLALVVARCLEKKPADRFKSMAALAEALSSPGRADKSGVFGFPRRLAAAAAALAVIAALIGLGARLRVPDRIRDGLGLATKSVQEASKSVQDLVEKAPSLVPPSPSPKAPAPTASAPARRPAPEEREPPAPRSKSSSRPRPATVELHFRSSPSGARVVRLDTGQRLGRTPLRLDVPRKSGNVWIQMTLDGYHPVKFTVDLRRDNTANVTFRGAKKTARRR